MTQLSCSLLYKIDHSWKLLTKGEVRFIVCLSHPNKGGQRPLADKPQSP